jgi:hypothetical protein
MPGGDPAKKLPKPASLHTWINVYDPADVLSFLAEPVFHGVEDLKMQDGAHLANSHNAYFGSRDFYEAVRKAVSGGP